jgi:hypothetical protein
LYPIANLFHSLRREWMMPTALIEASSTASACGKDFEQRALSSFSFNVRGKAPVWRM